MKLHHNDDLTRGIVGAKLWLPMRVPTSKVAFTQESTPYTAPVSASAPPDHVAAYDDVAPHREASAQDVSDLETIPMAAYSDFEKPPHDVQHAQSSPTPAASHQALVFDQLEKMPIPDEQHRKSWLYYVVTMVVALLFLFMVFLWLQ